MSAPMTSERCARLLADTKRILDLVEGPWTVPDRRDMEALSRIVQDVPALLDEVERAERGGKELGKVVVRLAELIKAAFVKGETDPAGALLLLGDHLAELFEDEGGLSTDDHARIYRALEQRRAEVERLRAELAQIQTAVTYLQGPEECLERECEEYFDDNGDERPGVEYCSHLKAKRLDVDEHLTIVAELDEAREQVRVLAGLLKRGNPKVFCAQHPNHAEPGCEVCRDAEIFRTAMDGTEGGQ